MSLTYESNSSIESSVYLCVCCQIENVEKFLHHVNVTMRQKHNHKQLSLVVDRIESYDAVDAPSDECEKVSHTSVCHTSVRHTSVRHTSLLKSLGWSEWGSWEGYLHNYTRYTRATEMVPNTHEFTDFKTLHFQNILGRLPGHTFYIEAIFLVPKFILAPNLKALFLPKYKQVSMTILGRSKSDLICHTHQHYHHQRLPNTEWS